jgi:hypothetical protein
VVKEYDPATKLGTLELESGEEVPFDGFDCDIPDPKPGDQGKAVVAPGRFSAELHAYIVRLKTDWTEAYIPLATALDQLHRRRHLLSDWGVEEAGQALRRASIRSVYQVSGSGRSYDPPHPDHVGQEEIAALIEQYYGLGVNERVLADRSLIVYASGTHAEYNRRLLAQLCAIVGEPDLASIKLRGPHAGTITDRAGRKHAVRTGDGANVIGVFNEILDAHGIEDRIFDGPLFGMHWYVHRSPDFLREEDFVSTLLR